MYHYAMEGNLMKRQRIQYLWGMLALMLLVYILLHDLLGAPCSPTSLWIAIPCKPWPGGKAA